MALEIMREARERVTSLVLVDTSARCDTPQRAATRRAGLASLAHGRFMGVTTRMLGDLVHRDHMIGPIATALQSMAGRVGREAFVNQQQAILERQDSRESLASIGVPTLVVVGDADRIVPLTDAEEMARCIPTAGLVVLPRCGHLPPIEYPAETASLVRRWLTTTQPEQRCSSLACDNAARPVGEHLPSGVA